jgi:hypothetical protein
MPRSISNLLRHGEKRPWLNLPQLFAYYVDQILCIVINGSLQKTYSQRNLMSKMILIALAK